MNKARTSTITLIFNNVPETLVKTVRLTETIKGVKTGKKKNKTISICIGPYHMPSEPMINELKI